MSETQRWQLCAVLMHWPFLPAPACDTSDGLCSAIGKAGAGSISGIPSPLCATLRHGRHSLGWLHWAVLQTRQRRLYSGLNTPRKLWILQEGRERPKELPTCYPSSLLTPARHSGLHQGAHCWETAKKFLKNLFGKNKGIKRSCYYLLMDCSCFSQDRGSGSLAAQGRLHCPGNGLNKMGEK